MVFTSFLTRRDLWFLTFLNCVLCVLGVCPGCVCGVTFGTISTKKMHFFASQLPHDYSYFTVLRETEPTDHDRNGERPFQRQGLSSPSQEGSGWAFQSRSVCWWGACKSRLKQQSPADALESFLMGCRCSWTWSANLKFRPSPAVTLD